MRKHTQTILVALIAVVLTASIPAGAHITKRLKHLIKHLNPVFLNQNEKAADSQLLDGIDSSGFLRFDGKAADAELLDGMDSSAFQGSFVRTIVVDTASELIAAVGSATPGTLIQLEPGTYNVGSAMLSLPNGVSMQGAGIRTTVVGAGSADPDHAVLSAGNNTEVRSLTILNTGNQPYAIGARILSNARLFDVNVQAQNGTTESVGIDVVTGGGSAIPLIRASGGFALGAANADAYAVRVTGVLTVEVRDSTLQAIAGSGGTATAFRAVGGGHRIEGSILTADTEAVTVTNGGVARIAVSRIDGGVTGGTCAGVYDGGFAFFADTCP